MSESNSSSSSRGLTAAEAGQQSERVRGRIGLGASASEGFDADLYANKEGEFATVLNEEEEEDDNMGVGR